MCAYVYLAVELNSKKGKLDISSTNVCVRAEIEVDSCTEEPGLQAMGGL